MQSLRHPGRRGAAALVVLLAALVLSLVPIARPTDPSFTLTLTCPDRAGIVHAVTGALLSHDGNITEAAQYDDPSTGLFFMRVRFASPAQLATHDPALVRAARGYALRMGIASDRYEFQMLYGVRRDAQEELTASGHRVRVYVPFGERWYPYFTRRIAERPSNALFVLRQFADR